MSDNDPLLFLSVSLHIYYIGCQRALREGAGGQADPAGRGDRVPVPARGQEGVRGGQGPRGALPQEGAAARPGDQGEVSVDCISLEQCVVTYSIPYEG